jgi:dTDP-4-dehydrorhamnose reductase
MVGRALDDHCRALGDQVFAYAHQSLDITNPELVLSTFRRDKPDVVINCAAWTDVDGCELDHARAFLANASGPENLALASRNIDAGLITISTDYVFEGSKEGFYTQRDQPNPQSVYGAAKLEGERRAQTAHARTTVVRSGFIFGPGGSNFLSTVLQRARRGEPIKAIGDAYGTPTFSLDLAARLRELAQLDLPGIFHVVNSGEGASFAEFTHAVLDEGGCSDTPLDLVGMKELNRPAPRPQNSRLKCLMSAALGLAPLPFWQDAVRNFVAQESRTVVAGK